MYNLLSVNEDKVVEKFKAHIGFKTIAQAAAVLNLPSGKVKGMVRMQTCQQLVVHSNLQPEQGEQISAKQH